MKEELLFDLESQRIFLNAINSRLKQQNQSTQKFALNPKSLTLHKTTNLVLLVIGMSIISLLASVSYFDDMSSYAKNTDMAYKTKYVIENLRGDTVNTWQHWNLVENDRIVVNIVNSGEVTSDKLYALKAAILSDEVIQIDDSFLHKSIPGSTSTYYLGWAGALKQQSKNPTKYYIPTEFTILESARGEGQITINLVTNKDTDGNTGYTKSITEDNQILKSTITIYDVDSLSAEQIAVIVRHEFGHALGLAHSTAPEDLMAPQISTLYPYISECDIAAITALYDGNESSQVICEK